MALEAQLTRPRRAALVWALCGVVLAALVGCSGGPEGEATGAVTDPLAAPEGYLLTVRSDGPRWLGASWWSELGLDAAQLDRERIRLFRGDDAVPLLWVDAPGSPGALFYGQTLSTTVGPVGTYRLSLDEPGPPVPIESVPLVSGEDGTCQRVTRATQWFEEDLVYRPTAPLESPWLWTSLRPPERFELTVTLPDAVAGEPATLTLHVWGQSAMPQDPDHHLRVIWDGVTVDDHFWDGSGPESWTVTLPDVRAGDHQLVVEAPGGTEAPVELNWIDALEITWSRHLRLSADEGLAWRAEASDVSCWDVDGVASDGLPWAGLLVDAQGGVRRAEPAIDPGSGDLRVAQRAGDEGWVGLPWLAPPPDAVRPREPLSVAALEGVSYLVVAPGRFHGPLEPLLAARRAEGYEIQLITPEAVYDTFGAGVPEAPALQTLVRDLSSQGRLAMLLLVGDASADVNELWDSETAGVPTAWVRTGYVGHTASDFTLATGGTDEPLVSVGRLPARTEAEVEALVAQTLAWEPSSRLLLVSDNEPEFAGLIAQLNDVREADRVLDAGQGEIREEMFAWLGEGPSTLVYAGHGSLQLLGNQKLIALDDRSAWQAPTVFVSWSCLCAGFAHPTYQSLAEALLLEPGGVVAFVGPTGETTTSEQRAMAIALQEALVDGETVGDALTTAWYAAISENVQKGFLLLGDPALRPLPGHSTGD